MNKGKIFLSIIIFIFFTSSLFAETNVSFVPDISGEFPNIATYNNFNKTLANGFREAIKFQQSLYLSVYILTLDLIDEEVNKFSFGFNCTNVLLSKYPSNSLNDLRYSYISSIELTSGMLIYFGIPIYKNLSLFFNAGFSFWSGVPFGSTLLWKFAHVNKSTTSKFYLSISTLFDFINIMPKQASKNNRDPLIGEYEVNNSNETINIKNTLLDKASHFVFTFDLSVKYAFSYKFLNAHATMGIGMQMVNLKASYICNTNVDYTGSGSPTGVDSSLYVDFKEKWVTFYPHLNLAVSFNITRWLRFPIIGGNFMYNPLDKKMYFGFSFNFLLMF